MSTQKVLLLEAIHPVAKEQLEKQGFEVERMTSSLSDSELISKLKGFDAVGIRSKTQLTQAVLAESSHLSAVGCFCIGTNQVDLEAANSLGIPVFNAPYSNTRSVAELVISEIIALSRGLFDRSAAAHKGDWMKTASGSHEIRGKTLGLVGYGHIGSQVSVLAEGMGMKVLFYDVIKKLPMGNAQSIETLEELLSQSDFVSLHVPETPETKNMISKQQLMHMKEGGFLINASRGTVVVIEHLVEALKSGHVGGAAVDVFPEEPKNNQEAFHSPLQGLANVILTPHIGGSTEEAQYSIGLEVAESLTRYLSQGSTGGSVNFPQVDLPTLQQGRRLINVHKNVPGVLGKINGIVSSAGVNILAQSLATDAAIGYLVMDMQSSDAKKVFEDIADLETSIKTRQLNS
ncbi:MAG: phosphoglycerate dehydrogenase [Bdellovibrionaceae bacterium]|nr:phosphoglycerate dehydrogenase [Pseudobdellovibrionaceae bacterium]